MSEVQEPNLESDFLPAADDMDAKLEVQNPVVAIDSASLKAVEVQTEQLEGRQRRISAVITIPHPVEQVWQVLTDYEALADFIPNLAKSQHLKHPHGGIRLEQIGTQRLLRFNFSARVVLDMEEKFPHEICFQMVEGDFKAFSGSWFLKPVSVSEKLGTHLCYSLFVLPKRTMPVALIESRIRQDMPLNLLAIRQRVDELFGSC